MFGKRLVVDMINRSAVNETDRRNFLRNAGVAGMGVLGATALSNLGSTASAAPAAPVSDATVLNFALNLEYLEAEFYSYAVNGHGLPDKMTTGVGRRGAVNGGRAASFSNTTIRARAKEIAADEIDHVAFLRKALGSAAVSRPAINIRQSFTAAARAAGLIGSDETFDPYASDDTFLLSAFVFEDVGVTAYKGAAPLLSNKTYLEAAAGILAVEAYQAGIIRTTLFDRGLADAADKISAARDSLDGPSHDDQGPTRNGLTSNLVPTDNNGIAFSRSPAQVLNVVYLTPKKARFGGFFPSGVNGAVNTSGG